MATLATWLALIRFSHTLFALPFALIAFLVATHGRPPVLLLVQVVLAVVAARTAAMAYNRWADRDVDAENPRTQQREIPRGALRPGAVLALALASGAAFVGIAFTIAPVCGALAVPVLLVLLGYSQAKRFTDLSHVWLGIALGLAPPAAHVAACGAVDATVVAPLLLGLGVVLWVAGFDILYACQDADFDRARGLRSLPARLGVVRAIRLAAVLHASCLVPFVAFGWLSGLSWPYGVGVAAAAGLLASEHWLVRGGDLARIDAAFFQRNALLSMGLLVATVVDLVT